MPYFINQPFKNLTLKFQEELTLLNEFLSHNVNCVLLVKYVGTHLSFLLINSTLKKSIIPI